MAEKKSFLLRVDAHTLELLKRWADDDLRSLNGQLEWLLKQGLKAAGRWAEERKEPPPPKAE